MDRQALSTEREEEPTRPTCSQYASFRTYHLDHAPSALMTRAAKNIDGGNNFEKIEHQEFRKPQGTREKRIVN